MNLTAVSMGNIPTKIIADGRKKPGRVSGVFHRAFHFADGRGALTAVVSSACGNSPLAILINMPDGLDFNKEGIKEGQLVYASDSAIRIPEADLEIDLSLAEVWCGNYPLDARLRRHPQDIRKNLGTARQQAIGKGIHNGLASLLRHTERIADGHLPDDPALSLLCRMAAKPLVDVAQGIGEGDTDRLKMGAIPLIGLGTGLTPSGDDVLTGVLGGLLFFRDRPGIECLFDELGDVLEKHLHGRTTLISEFHLKYSARGCLSEVLHCFILSLVASDFQDVVDRTNHLLRFGHSSGHEVVLGSLLCIDSILKRDQATAGQGSRLLIFSK